MFSFWIAFPKSFAIKFKRKHLSHSLFLVNLVSVLGLQLHLKNGLMAEALLLLLKCFSEQIFKEYLRTATSVAAQKMSK